MNTYKTLTIPQFLANSNKNYGKHNAMALLGEEEISYSEMCVKIQSLVVYLEKLNVQKGDKIAILSTNKPNWGISYFAIASMGAVVVPLLPDFSNIEIANALEHSEAKVIFIAEKLTKKIKNIENTKIENIIKIEDYSLIMNSNCNIEYKDNCQSEKSYSVKEDDLLSIIYTSGTTGRSKGVMLSHKNICSNAISASKIQEVNYKDKFLSILPLSHSYENTIGFILPIYSGACIYYLGGPPVPSILLKALKEVQPTFLLSVPLIIEKIYKSKILPSIQKNKISCLLHKFPPTRKIINKVAGKKLMETFGGKMRFFGIGGAKLNPEVEKFLLEAKFPYAIGYGLTETAPLIAGSSPANTKLQSTGVALEGVELKIVKADSKTGIGEIYAKGDNIMLGYYKDPKATAEVLTDDSWFKTGDLGIFRNGNLHIEGRLKNMILGASGENIYPEEIESVINNFKYVLESIVVQKKGKLIAQVHFNKEELEFKYKNFKEEVNIYIDNVIDELQKELKTYVNTRVGKYCQIQLIVVHNEPFKKTATHKIKRFLYL